MPITSLPSEIVVHCCHVSSSAAVWAAMRGVRRAWNSSLRTLPGAVWKEWALQRFHRLSLLARQWQPQADIDWKRMYQEQLEADRRGVPDLAHTRNRLLDQFMFTVEIWSASATGRTLAFEWSGEPSVPDGGKFHLQLWDPDQPPTGAWIALLNEEPDRADEEVRREWEARVTALNLRFSLWVSREEEGPDGSRFIRTVQLVDRSPLEVEEPEPFGNAGTSFEYKDLPNILLGNVADYVGVGFDEDREDDDEGYAFCPVLHPGTGTLYELIRPSNYELIRDSLTNDQLRFYLNHCVPWDAPSETEGPGTGFNLIP